MIIIRGCYFFCSSSIFNAIISLFFVRRYGSLFVLSHMIYICFVLFVLLHIRYFPFGHVYGIFLSIDWIFPIGNHTYISDGFSRINKKDIEIVVGYRTLHLTLSALFVHQKSSRFLLFFIQFFAILFTSHTNVSTIWKIVHDITLNHSSFKDHYINIST